MIGMLKRHEIQVLRRAGHVLEDDSLAGESESELAMTWGEGAMKRLICLCRASATKHQLTDYKALDFGRQE